MKVAILLPALGLNES